MQQDMKLRSMLMIALLPFMQLVGGHFIEHLPKPSLPYTVLHRILPLPPERISCNSNNAAQVVRQAQHTTRDEPLHHAAYNGNEKVVKELLMRGMQPNVLDHYGQTALFWAVERGHETIIAILLWAHPWNLTTLKCFSPKAQELLNTCCAIVEKSKLLLKERCQALETLLIGDCTMPTVLAALIVQYYDDLEIRMLLFKHAKTYKAEYHVQS